MVAISENNKENLPKTDVAPTDSEPVVKAKTAIKDAEESTPPSEERSKDDLKGEAHEHLSSGRRHILVGDLPNAVSTLADAASLISQVYDEEPNAPQCAEFYFYYGKALLELARIENGVLENVLDGVPEGESSQDEDGSANEDTDSQIGDPDKCTEEEKVDVSEKVGKAIVERTKQIESSADTEDRKIITGEKSEKNGEEEDPSKADKPPTKEAESKEADSKDDENGVEESSIEEVEENEEDPDGVEEEQPQEGEEEDPSNLQISWEMFECAKICYQKRLDAEKSDDTKKEEGKVEEQYSSTQHMFSETYQMLGEVSIENENYAQAIEDLKTCLSHRTAFCPPDSRLIAETHYQLSVALAYNGDFDAAIEALNTVKRLLNERVEKLKDGSASTYTKKKADYTVQIEIEELKKLIPEILEEIKDKENMKVESLKKANTDSLKSSDQSNGCAKTTTTETTGDSGKKPTDISHMVKKRKKDETSAAASVDDEYSAPKKAAN